MGGIKGGISTARVVGSIVLLILGMFCWVCAHLNYSRVTEVARAKPVHMDVDFSAVGRYNGTFDMSNDIGLGLCLQLILNPAPTDEGDLSRRLKGAQAHISIADANGKAIVSRDFTAKDLRAEGFSDNEEKCGSICIIFGNLPKGKYPISIEVTGAAQGLENTNQIVTASYLVCGMQTMPTFLGALGGIICIGLGIRLGRPRRKNKPGSAAGPEGVSD
jgi:hypothetical protein